jgi:hypothetical protein
MMKQEAMLNKCQLQMYLQSLMAARYDATADQELISPLSNSEC